MKPPTKNDVIAKYLYNDLERFLKRVYRYSKNPLIFSRVLHEYKKSKKGIRKEILKKFRNEYPGEVAKIITIHQVMVKHYNFEIDMDDIELCHRISYVLGSEIEKYNKYKYEQRIKSGYSPKFVSPSKAREELRARGFTEIYNFDKFNPKMSHIMSNNVLSGSIMVYPKNFVIGVTKGVNWWEIPNAYMVHSSIGLAGYTRVSTPKTK